MKVFVSSAIAIAALAAPARAAFPANVAALIDPTVNPCDDFYQYACGGWIKANPLGPSDVSIDASFSKVQKTNDKVIEEIVNQDWPLVGEFWDSCIDTATLDKLGNKPLQPVLNKFAQATTLKDVVRLAGELSRTAAEFVTGISVAGDYKDAKTNILYLGTTKLTLSSVNTYLDDKAFADLEPEFRKYITTVMNLSGFNPNATPSTQQGASTPAPVAPTYWEDTVIAVEKKLANLQAQIKAQTGDDAYYNPTTLGEVMNKYPVSVGAYFQGLGLLDKSKLTRDSKVIVNYFDHFDLSEQALATFDIKDLKTYIAFTYINNRVRYLSTEFYDAYFQFFAKKINGQQQKSPRNSICSTRLMQFFPDLIGKYYFMKMFDQERLDNTQLMTKLIEDAMGEHIQALDWLDNPTRLEAAGKLAKVANLIGQSKAKQSYPFTITRDQFLGNINTILNNDYEKKMKKLGNPVDRELWSKSPAEVNAYYSPLENKMVFPAAILQPPFFNGTAHPAQNFGSIGAVIGHELTHGFDSSGRRFDGDGNKRNWWTAATTTEFNKRATCMANQYSTFTVTGENNKPLIKVSGTRTITENIADNGGFSLSWDAYHKYASTTNFNDQGVSPADADKLLFLSFAQTWCGAMRDGAMVNQINTDPHSPGQWRANGVAMNNENFGKTFGCAAGTNMNPVNKCKLW